MKIKPFLGVIAAAAAALFVFFLSTICRNNEIETALLVVSGITLFTTAFGALAFTGDRFITNMRLLSALSFLAFFVISLVFALVTSTKSALGYYIFINGIFYLGYVLACYMFINTSKSDN